jgi:transcriptional antiterminator RfaH
MVKRVRAKRKPKLNYWGCVRTRRGQEGRAAHHVELQGFEFYQPQMWVPHKAQLRRATMFPGYLFVRVREGWRSLNGTRGVRSVLMTGERPSRIPDHEIAFLRSLEDGKGVVNLPPAFRVGDRVRMAGGQRFLRGRVGIVAALEAHECEVLLSIMGREVRKKMASALLEKA